MNVDVCIDAIYYAMVISASGIARFDRFGQMLENTIDVWDVLKSSGIMDICLYKKCFYKSGQRLKYLL